MNPVVLEWLLNADDPTELESPVGFDWQAETAEVRALQPHLEVILGQKLIFDDGIQDASFFAELALRQPGLEPNHWDTVLAVSFSAFGRLFTIWNICSPEDKLPHEVIERVIQEVTQHGYHYIDSATLDQPYTGNHPYFVGTTWRHRFFDWN